MRVSRLRAPAAARVARAAACAVLAASVALLAALSGARPAGAQAPAAPAPAASLTIAPGNLTILPDGRRVLSLHQWFRPPKPVMELDAQGRLVDFPRASDQPLPPLAAVLGIKSDTAGTLYILDNGLQGKVTPKVVVYDAPRGRLVRTIPLPLGVTDTNSFINDVAVDAGRQRLYIADPAGGANAALIVVNLADGTARRVLHGHESVRAADTAWTVLGKPLLNRVPSGPLAGTLRHPPTGVDGIAIDQRNEYVYFAPFDGRTMYRARAADLAAADTLGLAARVERYAAKPPSDGIILDRAGNLYLGDLTRNALGVIGPDRRYRELAAGLPWVDDFEFGADGALYVVTTQLERSPQLNAEVDASRTPFVIYRMTPLAAGRQGY
jgi:sugar lactone lactonase YvrE